MNEQYPNPQPDLPYPGPHQPQSFQELPVHEFIPQPTAWKSAPAAIRFAVWVWAISVIASLAGVALFLVLFVLGMNLAILGGH